MTTRTCKSTHQFGDGSIEQCVRPLGHEGRHMDEHGHRWAIWTAPASDAVNPSYYDRGGLKAIDVMDAYFSDSPYLWTVFKYIARQGKKGDALEDLKKARWYLDRYIGILEKKP